MKWNIIYQRSKKYSCRLKEVALKREFRNKSRSCVIRVFIFTVIRIQILCHKNSKQYVISNLIWTLTWCLIFNCQRPAYPRSGAHTILRCNLIYRKNKFKAWFEIIWKVYPIWKIIFWFCPVWEEPGVQCWITYSKIMFWFGLF